jgi:enduracididine beta-hydroxylase
MSPFNLTREEVAEIRLMTAELAARYRSAENEEFLNDASVIAHELPRRVRKALNAFRLFEPDSAVLTISGWPVDDEKIGPTPPHWRQHTRENDTCQEELLFLLLAALLGEPVGWSTQQGGRIVHDVVPIRGHEHEQVGTGSEEAITLHVEDAFHPYRGDYVGLMCLRNPDRVATTVAAIGNVALNDDERRVLASPYFMIRPDNSHLPKNAADGDGRTPEEAALVQKAYRKIEQMTTNPERMPILFGNLQAPYIRVDAYFMDPPEDQVARATFEVLQRKVDAAAEHCVLAPGDICFIDNFQAVHGRRPFKARYDGRDRWCKRINVVRDLRKSRDARLSAASRVMY